MSKQECYACLYAREFPAQAMLRLRPELRPKPCVVMEGEPPFQLVCSQNAHARTLGVVAGMSRVEIDIFPTVTVLSRSPAEESAAKSALFECAGTFTPRMEDCGNATDFIAILDIAGTEKLFGSPADLARSLLTRVRDLGITARVAISSNFHAAACLALGMPPRREIAVIQPTTERDALAPLPLSVLNLSPAHAETLSLWGIQTLGMLANLPETALIARLGQEGKRLRLLSRGELPHLFLPVAPAFTLEEHMELDSPVELLESLLFVLGVMLDQLILRAKARVLALSSVTLTLMLEGSSTHLRMVKPALPSTERALWLKLLHLDLEAHPPLAAVLSLTLTAEPGSTSKVQLGLFSPQLPEPDRLDITLARIRAIVGQDCVGRAVLKDTHNLEGFRLEPFTVPTSAPPEQTTTPSRAAMRHLRPPEPITLTFQHRRPVAFGFRDKRYTVEDAYGPWLASGDWWTSTLWGYEQWDLVARSLDGALLCCCLTHDLAHNTWHMAALYD